MRLPSAPLLAVFNRAARAKGYIGTREDSSHPGLEEFAEAIGVWYRSLARARDEGFISLTLADRIAVALDLHPILIWPAEYNKWLDVSATCAAGHPLAGDRCHRCDALARYERQRQGVRPSAPRWKPCRRCGADDRYPDGHCRPCDLRRKAEKRSAA